MSNKYKIILASVVGVLIIVLVIVFFANRPRGGSVSELKDEVIGPYKLSEDQEKVVNMLGLKGKTSLIAFKAPKEAITVEFVSYKMMNGNFERNGDFSISIGKERIPVDRLDGILSLILRDDKVIELSVYTDGSNSSSFTPNIKMSKPETQQALKFIEDYKEIELNKEIPVAIIVSDSGNGINAIDLNDFYDNRKTSFKDYDLTQFITVKFTDKYI